MKTGRRIPIKDAKSIGKNHGYSQVIIVAWDKKTGTEHVTTWGQSEGDCIQAAQGGNFVKKALGWPESLCNTEPARQRSRQKLKHENKELRKVVEGIIEILEYPSSDDEFNLKSFKAWAMTGQTILEKLDNK